MRSVGFAYGAADSAKVVMRDFSLAINKGEIVTLIGPSGCGKTTIVKLAAGLLFPSEGHIYFNGCEVRNASRERGVVFQEDSCYPWLTVVGNIQFGISGREPLADLNSLLDLVGLSNERHFYPSQLSFGMKQRVALARAIAAGAELLLLDEPLSALDALSRSSLQREVGGILRGTKSSALWVTHDLEEALLMGDRLVVVSGSPMEVLREIRPGFNLTDLGRQRFSSEFISMKKELFHFVIGAD